MRRIAPLVSLAAVGLGTLLTGACGFHGSTDGVACEVQSGSATVSSPTGYFGPPDISGVDRAYNLQGACSVTVEGDFLTDDVVTVTGLAGYAEYHPATHEAREEIRGTGINARSEWTCDRDPWVAAGAQCTRTSFEGAGGKAYDHLKGFTIAPASAAYLDAEKREIILQRLIADYKDKAALFPNPCPGEAEYTSLVTAPTEGQQITAPDSVLLNVKRGAAPGCTTALDGVDPVFDVEWEYADATGNYTIAPIVASFDARASTHAIPILFTAFAQFGASPAGTAWRVRARLSLQPDAVWSDWVNFTLVGTP